MCRARSAGCAPTVAPRVRSVLVLALVLPFALILSSCGGAPAGPGRERARVERVVDGDTVVVRLASGTRERVRYIGIDTPEVREEEPCASRATVRNRELVGGRDVELVFDAERRDRYGRLLAYVEASGRSVNAALVREGLAEAREYPPNTARAEQLEGLERARGLWTRC